MRLLFALALVLCAGRAHAQSGLSAEDWRLIRAGEIGIQKRMASGMGGTLVGFGVGHLIQGRLAEGGVFFLGEIAATGVLVYGVTDCLDDGDHCAVWAVWGGVIVAAGLKIWEIVDVWSWPVARNARVRAARARAFQPIVAPVRGGGTAGFAIRF